MQKKYSLKKRREFNYIYNKGKSFSSKFITLVFVPSKYSLKIGFSVNKKVGNSVIRNRVKRKMRESCRLSLNKFKDNTNYIFIARSNASQASFVDIKNDILFLLEKANLFNHKGE